MIPQKPRLSIENTFGLDQLIILSEIIPWIFAKGMGSSSHLAQLGQWSSCLSSLVELRLSARLLLGIVSDSRRGSSRFWTSGPHVEEPAQHLFATTL